MHESEKGKWSRSVVSDPPRPHGLQPTRLLRPWDFPGKSTGVGCHCLLRAFTLAPHKSEKNIFLPGVHCRSSGWDSPPFTAEGPGLSPGQGARISQAEQLCPLRPTGNLYIYIYISIYIFCKGKSLLWPGPLGMTETWAASQIVEFVFSNRFNNITMCEK